MSELSPTRPSLSSADKFLLSTPLTFSSRPWTSGPHDWAAKKKQPFRAISLKNEQKKPGVKLLCEGPRMMEVKSVVFFRI